VACGIVVVPCALHSGEGAKAPAGGGGARAGQYTISEPIAYENLTIFMIHGKDRIKGTKFLTLKEALEKKVAILHETGSVGRLTIQNLGDKPIYVQSGDIVKGGKQDRTLQWDMVVPAKSGKVPLKSFCVEQRRWSQRGRESADKFDSSRNMLASKDLKLAAKSAGNQGEVWREVDRTKKKLSANLGVNVSSAQSASSLELALDNKQLREAVDKYVKKLAKAPEGRKGVVGFAFAINGEVNSIDVYASSALFRKLWPKLLKASATEAVAERKKDGRFPAVKVAAVEALIAEMQKGKASTTDLSKRIRLRKSESASAVVFDTVLVGEGDVSVHTNYIKK